MHTDQCLLSRIRAGSISKALPGGGGMGGATFALQGPACCKEPKEAFKGVTLLMPCINSVAEHLVPDPRDGWPAIVKKSGRRPTSPLSFEVVPCCMAPLSRTWCDNGRNNGCSQQTGLACALFPPISLGHFAGSRFPSVRKRARPAICQGYWLSIQTAITTSCLSLPAAKWNRLFKAIPILTGGVCVYVKMEMQRFAKCGLMRRSKGMF